MNFGFLPPPLHDRYKRLPFIPASDLQQECLLAHGIYQLLNHIFDDRKRTSRLQIGHLPVEIALHNPPITNIRKATGSLSG
jgi:hypothetical protein